MTPTTADTYDIAREAIQKVAAELRELSLDIHDHPELGSAEHRAHKVLTDYLRRPVVGFEVHSEKVVPGINTAFVATYSKKHGGKRVGLCSEYDALPDIGHACGHNLIAVVGVAAAIGVRAVMEKLELPGELYLYGTPAEETDGGKINMIDAGVFKGLDACIMAHPSNMDASMGNFLAIQAVEVEYFGKAAHAAGAPWNGINALDALVVAYQNIGLMRQQMLPTNRVHGIILDGGAAPNIIPDYARGRFYIRSRTMDELSKLRERVTVIFEGAGTSSGCLKMTLTWKPAFLDVLSNKPLAERYQVHMVNHSRYPFYPCPPELKTKMGFSEQKTQYPSVPDVKFPSEEEMKAVSHGSTDMGNVTHEVPGIHTMFSLDTAAGIHTKDFRDRAGEPVAHALAMRAAAGLACTLIDVLINDNFAQSVRRDFASSNRWRRW